MIAWIHPVGTTTTHLIAFDDRMKKIADLLENGDDWTILIGSREMKVNGRGCADPVDFVERMLSPKALMRARRSDQDDPLLMRFTHASGETWEVWNAE